MTTNIAIIGDYFMLPSVFEEKIRTACKNHDIDIRTHQDDWPNTPMEHGYATAGLEGLKEYYGHPDAVVDFIQDAEIFITHLSPISHSMLDKLPNLKCIGISRGGPVNIDMDAARKHNISVFNVPGRNASAVAEFTLGAILTETRRIRIGHETLRQGVWRGDLYRHDTTGRELSELTVGVVGYGNIGRRVVKLLKAFGCHVLVCDPYVQLSIDDINDGVEHVDFDTVLQQSDVVTMHARVTHETTHMFNKDTFAKMKSDAIFINAARGPLCQYDDLYHALTNGQIAAAMLDTFSIEPTDPDDPLLQLPNITITPHIAGASVACVDFAAEQIAQNVRRYLDNEPLVNIFK